MPKPDPFVYEMMVRRHRIDPTRSMMVEDLPNNLLPAHALGMTTVLVRTEEEWAQAGADGDHVHHVTDDLVAWLEAAGVRSQRLIPRQAPFPRRIDSRRRCRPCSGRFSIGSADGRG